MPKINPDALELEEQVIRTNKVQKTHKGGRTLSWNVLVAVGDRAGHVGVGLGKARGIPDAIRKGMEDAKKRMIEVPLVGHYDPARDRNAVRCCDGSNEAGFARNRCRCGWGCEADPRACRRQGRAGQEPRFAERDQHRVGDDRVSQEPASG